MSPSLIFRGFLLMLAFAGSVVFAQKTDEDDPQYSVDWFEDASLADLLGMKIGVASGGQQVSQREAPGITTLISADEIMNSGARDLEEVLRLLVPGMDFGQDVQGVSGPIMRGIWAHEGKLLVMLDGVEMNEYTYNVTMIANRFDLNMIDRIEVIRGPGSARYGGTAELGVINIITLSGSQLEGRKSGAQLGGSANAVTRQNLSLNIGSRKNGWEYVAHGHLSDGVRSDQSYTSGAGATYSLKESMRMSSAMSYVRIARNGLKVNVLGDIYRANFQHYGGVVLSQSYPSIFKNARADIRYEFDASKRWKLTAGYCGGYNESYTVSDAILPADTAAIGGLEGSQVALRGHAFFYADYTASRGFSLNIGAEDRHERVTSTINGEPLEFWNGNHGVVLNLASAFAQAVWKTRIATFTTGARLDYHNIYGVAAAPRLALTRVWEQFHLKVLAAGGYRNPAAMNLAFSPYDAQGLPSLRPERAWVAEAEAGYRFNTHWYVQANFFTSLTGNTIVYVVDGQEDVYENLGRSGTSGVEAEVRYKGRKAYATLNYSFYSVLGNNDIYNYSAGSSASALMGAAQHKLALNSNWKITDRFSVSPSLVYLSGKYAFMGVDADGEDIETQQNATTLLNIALLYDGLLNNRLSLALTGSNLLGSQYLLVQPYHSEGDSNDLPIRYPNQEVALRAAYKLGK